MAISTRAELDLNPFITGLKTLANKSEDFATDFAKSFAGIGKKVDVSGEFKKQFNEMENAGQKFRKGLEVAFDVLEKSGKDSLEALKKQMAVLVVSGQKGSKEFNQIQKELKESAAEARKFQSALDDVNKEIGEIGDSSKGGGLSEFLNSGVGKATILTGVATAATGLAKSIFDANKETQVFLNTASKLTGLKGESLNDYANKAESIANTFGGDLNEVLLASNALAKEMGIESTEALGLIEKGFLAGADVNGEFLSQLREYPAQFKAVGLNAEQSIAIMTQSAKEGIFSDKGADLIKEVGLRLREMPKSTEDALSGIGIVGAELKQQITSGNITMFEAVQMVSEKLQQLPATSNEVGTAIADVFGGPGEDAGLRYINMLSTMELGLGNIIDESDKFYQQQKQQLDLNEALASIKTTLADAFQPVISTILPTVTKLIGNLKPVITNVMTTAGPIIEILANTFSDVVEAVTPVLDILLDIVQKVLPPLVAILKPILSLLSPILQVVGALLEALTPILDILGLLVTAIAPLITLLANILAPILQVIAKIITVLITTLLVKLAAKFKENEKMVKLFSLGVEAATKIIEGVSEKVFGLIDALGKLLGMEQKNNDSKKKTAPFRKDEIKDNEEKKKGIDELTKSLDGNKQETEKLFQSYAKLRKSGKDISEVTAQLKIGADVAANFEQRMNSSSKAPKAAAKSIQELKQAMAKLIIEGKENTKQYTDLSERVKTAIDKETEFKAALEKVDEQFKNNGKTIFNYSKGLRTYAEMFKKITNEIKAVNDKQLSDKYDAEIKNIEKLQNEILKSDKDLTEAQIAQYKELQEQKERIGLKKINIDLGGKGGKLEIEPILKDTAKKNLIDKFKQLDDDLQKVINEGSMNLEDVGKLAVANEKLKNDLLIQEETRLQNEIADLRQQTADKTKELQDRQLSEEKKKNDETLATYKEYADKLQEGIAGTTEALILGQEDASKSMITIALDTLESLIPILVAEILGKEFASKSLAGIATAAALTGLLYGALNAARSAAGYEEGGLVPGSEQLIKINERGQEFVMNAKSTKQYLPLLKAMNENRMNDFYRYSYMPDSPVTDSSPITRSDINRLIEATNSTRRHEVKTGVQLDGNFRISGNDLQALIKKQNKKALRSW